MISTNRKPFLPFTNKGILFPAILLVLILLIMVDILLPPFLYNKLERRFRQEYSEIFDNLDKAESEIKQRKATLALGDVSENSKNLNTAMEYGNAAESDIHQALLGIQTAEKYANYQSWLLPFIDDNYKHYHRDKLEFLADHKRSVNDFYILKKNEHMATNTVGIVILTQQIAYDFENQEEWWEAMAAMPETTKIIAANAQQLFESGYIDDELYAYYLGNVKLFTFLHDQSKKIAEANNWDELDTSTLIELASSGSAIYNREMFDRMMGVMSDKSEEYNQRKDKNLLDIHNNVMYYDENRLGIDGLSFWLYKIKSAF